jgi:hypothetical protein
MDPKLRLRFAAKVALGAGLFAYGRAFVEHAQADQLRALMNLDVDRMSDDLKVVDHFMSESSEQQKIVRALGKHVGLSSVVIIPSSKDITFVVTCLREFCGLLRVPADTSDFPNEGLYRLGHILACDGCLLNRGSLQDGLKLFQDAVNKATSD